MEREHTFRILRFDPEAKSKKPGWQHFTFKMRPNERVLDALLKIKNDIDGSLTFRRSCGHGICGSCAMQINGKNALACQSLMKDMPVLVRLEPLPAFPVIKDLVVDMRPFFEKNDAVLPYLINDEPLPERERLQSQDEQRKTEESATCIMCSSCTSSCPSHWADKEYIGPSALLKAYRFIFDSRDRAADERLIRIASTHGLWRCHSIFNCVETCPKGIDIAGHISRLKREALHRKLR